MEYGAQNSAGKLSALAAAACLVAGLLSTPALAEHSSGGYAPGTGFPTGESTRRPGVNDGRTLALPTGKTATAVLPPPVDNRALELRITSSNFANRDSISTQPVIGEGYNAPRRTNAPAAFVPYGNRIGLSRVEAPVPQGALPSQASLAVQ